MQDLPDDIALRWLLPGAAADGADVLTDDERARMQSFGHPKRKAEFERGRIALRLLLAERLGVAPRDVPLQVAADGAVELAGFDEVVSIAHAGGRAVAAAGRRALGVDVERIVPRRPDLYRFLLHSDEYGVLDVFERPMDEALLICWTLKEATLKARRSGFRLSPKKLRLEPQGAQIHIAGPGGERWHARFEVRDGFVVSVAYDPRQ